MLTSDQMKQRVNNKLRTLTGKLAERSSVTDFDNGSGAIGWVNDGTTNESAAFAAAMASSVRTIRIPFSSACYNLGTTGISFTSYHWLRGEGRGNPASGSTCFKYTGTGCGVTFDSVMNAGMSDIDVQVDSSSATARGVCFKSSTNVSEFNSLENISIQMVNTTPRTTGQVGLDLTDTAQGIFWNHFRGLRFKRWDISAKLTATGTTQGTNSNTFYDLMSFAHNTAFQLRAGSKQVSDNRFYGVTCSRSDGTQTGATACFMMGDDNVAGVFANSVFGLDNDSGSPDTCGTLGTTAGANYVDAVCNSGGGFSDNGVGIFANSVCNRTSLGSLVSICSIGNLSTTRGATIIGSTFFGALGGASGTGAGGAVNMGGGAGASGQAGGAFALLGGTAGAGNAAAGDVLASPGGRTGTGAGGTFVAGPISGLGAGSGTRIRSSRVTLASKPFTPIDCGGGNPSLTISQLLDVSIFTCGTAQTINIPSAAGVGGIVQNLPGASAFTNGAVAVGDLFEFQLISTAAANFTLTASSGVTLVGNTVVNNGSKIVRCRVTGVSSGTETVSCYL